MDLASLLRHTEHNGIYHLPPGERDALTAATHAVGLPYYRCDLAENPALDAALSALGAALGLPAWYGANLDALHDCLTDFSWRDDAGGVLLLAGCDALHAMDSEGFDALMSVFAAAAEFWQAQEVPFWVFVDMRADGLAYLPTIG